MQTRLFIGCVINEDKEEKKIKFDADDAFDEGCRSG